MLDADTWKTIISVVSATVATFSAFLAHRAKVQTRADLFAGARDGLVLAMAKNNARADHLMLKCSFAREGLADIPTYVHGLTVTAKVKLFNENLDEVDRGLRSLGKREFSIGDIEALKYSEATLSTVRDMARNEQVIGANLADDSYQLLFDLIDVFVKKHALPG